LVLSLCESLVAAGILLFLCASRVTRHSPQFAVYCGVALVVEVPEGEFIDAKLFCIRLT
jgi:hypothetical protein